MEGHLVIGVSVNSLEYVNFSLVRPVRSNHPAANIRSYKGIVGRKGTYNAGQLPQFDPGT